MEDLPHRAEAGKCRLEQETALRLSWKVLPTGCSSSKQPPIGIEAGEMC